jgi:hypothetical protein
MLEFAAGILPTLSQRVMHSQSLHPSSKILDQLPLAQIPFCKAQFSFSHGSISAINLKHVQVTKM